MYGATPSASLQLDEHERTVVRLLVLEDLTQREAAERLKCSQANVNRRLHAAVAKLRAASPLVLDPENF